MFKKGDVVVCIYSVNKSCLTEGKSYIVTDSDNSYTWVKSDDGLERYYMNKRFKKKPYSSHVSMQVDSLQEEYGPVVKPMDLGMSDKSDRIKYHLDQLKELTT